MLLYHREHSRREPLSSKIIMKFHSRKLFSILLCLVSACEAWINFNLQQIQHQRQQRIVRTIQNASINLTQRKMNGSATYGNIVDTEMAASLRSGSSVSSAIPESCFTWVLPQPNTPFYIYRQPAKMSKDERQREAIYLAQGVIICSSRSIYILFSITIPYLSKQFWFWP